MEQEILRMKFVFDENKLKANGMTEDECLNIIRKYAFKHNLTEIENHVRMDFGRSGNEFWHTWNPRGAEELNSPAFKAELQKVVDMMRENVLKNRIAMAHFCYEHGGRINGDWIIKH